MSDPPAPSGHVFVIKGNIRNLACDAYLQSADKDFRLTEAWATTIPDAPSRLDPRERAAFQAEETFALPLRPRDPASPEAVPIVTAVPYRGVVDADQLRGRVRDFFRVAHQVVLQRVLTRDQQYPMVALPLFGTDRAVAAPSAARSFASFTPRPSRRPGSMASTSSW